VIDRRRTSRRFNAERQIGSVAEYRLCAARDAACRSFDDPDVMPALEEHSRQR